MNYYEEEEPTCPMCDGEGCEDCDEEIKKAKEAVETRANNAMAELTKMFSALNPEAVHELASQAAQNIVRMIESSVRDKLKELVMRECGYEVKRLAAAHMKEVFAQVLGDQIVTSGGNWDTKKEHVRTVIQKEMTDACQKLKLDGTKSGFVQETINSFLSKELNELAQQAVRQFKSETIAELKKESMGSLVQAIAKTLVADKKLMALIDAQ